MTKEEIHELFRRTCTAIEGAATDEEVARLMAELEATGDEEAIAAAHHTMQWRSKDNRPGSPPPPVPPESMDTARELYLRTCSAITDPSVPDEVVKRLLAELKATGTREMYGAARLTMECREPEHLRTTARKVRP